MATKRRSKAKFIDERTPAPLKPLTPTQGQYLDALATHQQIVVLGPAGTGKTFIAGTHAADCLMQHRVSKVIITRPNVPGGRSLGFFPGDLNDKVAPWVAPLIQVIGDRMSPPALEIAMKRGALEIVPFEVMRGRSWDDALIILDEAQNTTSPEIKMFLTRIGQNSQVIINGDIEQSDLRETSGLKKALRLIAANPALSEASAVIEFTVDDIVRSDLCALWVRAFHKDGQ